MRYTTHTLLCISVALKSELIVCLVCCCCEAQCCSEGFTVYSLLGAIKLILLNLSKLFAYYTRICKSWLHSGILILLLVLRVIQWRHVSTHTWHIFV